MCLAVERLQSHCLKEKPNRPKKPTFLSRQFLFRLIIIFMQPPVLAAAQVLWDRGVNQQQLVADSTYTLFSILEDLNRC